MKRTHVICISLAALVACASPVIASDSTVKQTLSSVAAPELAAKAAELVAQASAKDRERVTVEVIISALAIRPVAAAAVVGAIARSTPAQAAIAAVPANATMKACRVSDLHS